MTALSFLGSTHFILNFLNLGTPIYYFHIFTSSTIFFLLVKKQKISTIYQRIGSLKYFLLFFIVNLFVQFFYHNLSFADEIRVLGYALSFFTNVLALSFLFDRKGAFNFFIKICKSIMYLLIFLGIINALGILTSSIFFVPHKNIENYNFLFLRNTASLLEHQISYGSTIAILFSTLFYCSL